MLTITRQVRIVMASRDRDRDPVLKRATDLLSNKNIQPINFQLAVNKCIDYFQAKDSVAITCSQNIVSYFNKMMDDDINFGHQNDPIIFDDDSSPRSVDSDDNVSLVLYSSSDDDDGNDARQVKRRRADTSNIDLNHADFMKFLSKHLKRIVLNDTSVRILECGIRRPASLVFDTKRKEILRRVFLEGKIRNSVYKHWIEPVQPPAPVA